MVSRSLLKISFVLRCDNADNDLIHGFEFDNEENLLNFLREHDSCPECDSLLLRQDIRVFYKMTSEITGETYE